MAFARVACGALRRAAWTSGTGGQIVATGARRRFGSFLQQNRERLGLIGDNEEKVARMAGRTSEPGDEFPAISIRKSARDWDAAYAVFKSLEAPSSGDYAAILHAADKCNMQAKSEELFQQMKSRGIPGRVDAFTSLINISGRQGDTDRVRVLLAEMKDARVSPDVMAYSAALNGYAKRCDIDGAIAVMRELQDANLEPTGILFASFMNVFAEAGRADLCRQQLREMEKYNLKPSSTHWNTVLKACNRMRDSALAFSTLDEMLNAGVVPNVASFTTVLGAIHRELGSKPQAQTELQRLLQRMEAADVRGDGYFYESLARARMSRAASHGVAEALDKEPPQNLEAATADLRKAEELLPAGSYKQEGLMRAIEAALQRHRSAAIERPAAAPMKAAVLASSSKAQTLEAPAIWVEVASPQHGQSYYWNQATGVTQWERPVGERISLAAV